MSSWFRGLGSGLGRSLGQVGGTLAALRGHVPSVTINMPAEGTEEAGELPDRRSQEPEATHALLRWENDRLRKLCADLQEQPEAAQLQAQPQATMYRDVLLEKERDIGRLREELARLRGQRSPAAPVAQPEASMPSPS